MTWTLENSLGQESDKIAHLVVPYTRGRGLDVGCGQRKVWPHVIGVDDASTFGPLTQADVYSKADDLSIFSPASLDFVFSSHMLEDYTYEDAGRVLAEWSRVVKTGGYLILYVPSANLYPHVGEPGANPRHKWDIYPGDLSMLLSSHTECGWTLLEDEERSDGNEYSHYYVVQKRDDGQWIDQKWERNPDGRKRVLVIRYGAIGDILIAASIFPRFRAAGLHVTLNTIPVAQDLLKYNPYVDEFLMQDTNQVPNEALGAYWESLKERYDVIVNLCESIEGQLLSLPGRLQHGYPHFGRHATCNINYLEHTHNIAGVPHIFDQTFYRSAREILDARRKRNAAAGTAIYWCINGSSPHKCYPFTDIVMKWVLDRTDAHIYFSYGFHEGKSMQDALLESLENNGCDMTRIHPRADDSNLREALSFAHECDVVVGPETGPLNAASFDPKVAKVVMLSHSSEENLTKHWKNTTALVPKAAHCYPCHRLHFTWDFCNQVPETGAALCASNIAPEEVFRAIRSALAAKTRTLELTE